MGFGTPVSTHSTPKLTTERAKQGWRAEPCWRFLLDADLGDEAQDIVVGHIVEGPHIGFLEAFAQILGGDEAGFAVGQVAPGFISKFHECGMRQADYMGLAVDK